ncbi:MAG: cobalamin B12-binding domain-containing protein [Candidatus Firestonebacteria bacterium]|nr:cobalamin B12-binding domain-containing protein [Candidatus Firestonebacteria bacterium]
MKIMLIFPNFLKYGESHPEFENDVKHYLWGSTSIPGLGLPHIAANTPPEHEIIFVDDQFDEINFDAKVDLVGLSVFTPQLSRAVVIAKKFKEKGIPVAMGGKHITNNPDEALQYCNYVFIGEAEITWQLFLKEFQEGKAKRIYRNETIVDVKKLPLPKRSIVNEKNYPMNIGTLICIRGCGLYCDCCTVDNTEQIAPAKNRRIFDFDWLAKDIQNTSYQTLYISCNSINHAPKDFIIDLLKIFKESGKKFILSTTPFDIINKEKQIPGFIKLIIESGIGSFYYALNNIPSILPIKITERFIEYTFTNDDITKKCQDAGIEIIPSIVFGNDFDTPDVFEKASNYLLRNNISDCEFTLFTPYPGSPSYKKMEEEKRLLTKDWFYYNNAHVVFKPTKMSSEELLKGYISIWKNFINKNRNEFKNIHISNLFKTGEYLQKRKNRKLDLTDFAHFNENFKK